MFAPICLHEDFELYCKGILEQIFFTSQLIFILFLALILIAQWQSQPVGSVPCHEQDHPVNHHQITPSNRLSCSTKIDLGGGGATVHPDS